MSPGSRAASTSLFVGIVLLLTGCASWIPRPQPNPDSPYGHDPRVSSGTYATKAHPDTKQQAVSEVSRFLELDADAADGGVDADKNRKYLNQGFGLSDRMCSEWFDSLESRRETAEYRQGTASLTGALTGTVMGLFKSAPNEIGAAAAVFGAVDGWYRLGKATFFLTPKLGTVREKIQSLRATMATDLAGNEKITASYQLSYQALAKYQDTCGILALAQFIETATELAKYTYTPSGELDAATKAQLASLSKQFLTKISWPNPDADIDTKDWTQLYVLVFGGTTLADTLKNSSPSAVATELKAAYDKLSDPAAKDPTAKAAAQQLLAAIGSVLKVSKDVQAAQQEVDKIQTAANQQRASLASDSVGRATADQQEKTRLRALIGNLGSASRTGTFGEIKIVSGPQ